MCRVCRARGLIRGARHGGGPNGLTVVHGPLPVVDHDDDGEDDILCSVATADDDAHATTFPPSPPRTVRVVVGAGVAGTCCAEELCRLRPEDAVILVTIGDVVKSVQHVEKVTRNIEVFDVVERPVSALGHENLTVYRAHAVAMDRLKKELFLEREDQEDSKIGKRDHEEEEAKQTLSGFKPRDVKTWTLRYDQLVVCSGAAPRGIFSSSQKQTTEENQTQTQTQTQNKTAAAVTVTVRDVESVCELRQRLRTARRALLVGNGGIAMELADALCRASGSASTGGSVSKISKHVSLNKEKDQLHTRELVWAAKHCTIGDAFFDRDASAFLQTLAERSGCMQDACATGASRLGSNERGGGGWKDEKHADGEGNGASLSAGTGKRVKRKRGTHETEGTVSRPNSPTAVLSRETAFGNAAGPDWVSRLGAGVRGKHGSGNSGCEKFGLKILNDVHLVDVEAWGGVEEGKERGDEGDAKEEEKEGKYGTETETETEKWPAVAVLSDGRRLGVDVIVAATGVDASVRVDWLPTEHFPRGKDGGIAVTETFQSIGDPCVFAAGDAASAETRTADTSTHWFQMRTWSQARSSGTYVARVMVGDADSEAFGFNYELFTHTTIFFGKKCVLLGRYNGQKFGEEDAGDLKSYARSTFSDESDSPKDSGEVEPDVFRGGAAGSNQSKSTDTSTFVRVLLHKNKMVGAVLLGNTDLEETFENLILDQIDLARFGASLLDPEVDLEDYFD